MSRAAKMTRPMPRDIKFLPALNAVFSAYEGHACIIRYCLYIFCETTMRYNGTLYEIPQSIRKMIKKMREKCACVTSMSHLDAYKFWLRIICNYGLLIVDSAVKWPWNQAELSQVRWRRQETTGDDIRRQPFDNIYYFIKSSAQISALECAHVRLMLPSLGCGLITYRISPVTRGDGTAPRKWMEFSEP